MVTRAGSRTDRESGTVGLKIRYVWSVARVASLVGFPRWSDRGLHRLGQELPRLDSRFDQGPAMRHMSGLDSRFDQVGCSTGPAVPGGR